KLFLHFSPRKKISSLSIMKGSMSIVSRVFFLGCSICTLLWGEGELFDEKNYDSTIGPQTLFDFIENENSIAQIAVPVPVPAPTSPLAPALAQIPVQVPVPARPVVPVTPVA